mgnify:CR=1 FL=1
MLKPSNFLISFCIIALFSSPAAGQADDNPASKHALAPLREALEQLEKDWAKNRSETITVLDIEGLEHTDGKDERTLLERRLETLQNKKISNREWATYWQTEATLADKISEIYRKLVEGSGDGRSLLQQEHQKKAGSADAARVTYRSKQDAFAKAATEREKAEKSVRQLMTANADAIRTGLVQTDALQKRASTASQRLSAIADQIKSTTKESRLKTLNDKKIKIAEQVTTLENELKSLQEKTVMIDQTQALIQKVLTGEPVPEEGFADDVKARLLAYVAQRDTLERLTRERAQAKATADKLETESARAKRELELYSDRINALQAWSSLAQKKVSNQSKYYEAIEGDIEAINERLRSVRTTKKDEKIIYAADVCDAEPDDENTPFAHHRECTRAIRSELKRISRDIEQHKQKEALTKRLRDSSKTLIEAQEVDEALVKEEYQISHTEADRTRDARGESQAWNTIWSDYSTGAEKKTETLIDAVKTSKLTERALRARAGVYEDTLKRLKDNKDRATAYLNHIDTPLNTVMAVVVTAWQIIRVGWPALVYIFIAFLIIRLIRKNRDRLEQKALLAQDGKGNDELDALIAELEAARERDDEEDIIQLTNVIGNAESKIKDEGQRIGTIARVGAQALSLIVYVATGLLVLDALTVDIKPILGGAAIFGLAISFGSQSLVKDVVSGFFILLENQYAVGDVVTINSQSGTVEKVTLRRTVLRDIKGGVHNITNGSISSVKNNTQGWARVIIDIGVAYGTDIAMVEEVVNAVGAKMYRDPKWRGKLTEVPAFVGVIAFGESEVTVRAWFQTRTFQNWGAEREFNRRLKFAFETAGIQIPFPQRELRIVREVEVVPAPTDES